MLPETTRQIKLGYEWNILKKIPVDFEHVWKHSVHANITYVMKTAHKTKVCVKL